MKDILQTEDIHLSVDIPKINNEVVNLNTINYLKVEVFSSDCEYKKVELKIQQGNYKSTGSIKCSGELTDNIIHLYIQSSVTPFGLGQLKVQMEFNLTNPKFPNGYQKIRTKKIPLDFNIISDK